jgi:hypothetical protein
MMTESKKIGRLAGGISKMENNIQKVNLQNTGEIELPKLDVSGYVGRKTKIVKVGEYEGKFGNFIKLETETIDTLERDSGSIEVRATRVFGLQKDKDGNIGWGAKTKLGVYLAKMGVTHYRDLVGKEVVIQTTTNKEGVDFLTFN